MRRVVITGLGIVAPTGNTVATAWESAVNARPGISRIDRFDASALPVQIAGEIRNFDPTEHLSAKVARQASRFIQFTASAAGQAIADAGLDVRSMGQRCGCAVGVGLGDFGGIERESHTFRDRGPRRVSPLLLPYAIPNMAAGFLSTEHGMQGPNYCVATACASGSHAIGQAYHQIQHGLVDAMLAGGSEAATSPLSLSAFARMRALSTRNDDPTSASRPFDRDRDGFVMGEGSGMLMLEELEHAQNRGARILAELTGFGMSADAHHITNTHPEGEGLARAMHNALTNVSVADIDYVNAHGTSTQANDASESAAISSLFGEYVHKLSISSTKGVTGHCLGAAGAIEAVYTVLAIHHQTVPPTANLENQDPACQLNYTPLEPVERPVRHAMSNSSGFGGQNASLVFSAP